MKLRKPTAPYAAGAKIGLTTILTSTMSTNMPGDNDICLGISKFAYGLNSLCFMNKTLLNIGLALAVALFLCLLPLPYGYYSLLRVAVTVYAVCLAAGYYKSGNTALCMVSVAVAILFQPFAKIYLGRGLWNVVDVLLAVALVWQWVVFRH